MHCSNVNDDESLSEHSSFIIHTRYLVELPIDSCVYCTETTFLLAACSVPVKEDQGKRKKMKVLRGLTVDRCLSAIMSLLQC